jgi:hypothetical protein
MRKGTLQRGQSRHHNKTAKQKQTAPLLQLTTTGHKIIKTEAAPYYSRYNTSRLRADSLRNSPTAEHDRDRKLKYFHTLQQQNKS